MLCVQAAGTATTGGAVYTVGDVGGTTATGVFGITGVTHNSEGHRATEPHKLQLGGLDGVESIALGRAAMPWWWWCAHPMSNASAEREVTCTVSTQSMVMSTRLRHKGASPRFQTLSGGDDGAWVG